MPFIRRNRFRYRRNPPVRGNMRYGLRVRDQQTGFPSYIRKQIADDFGVYTDPEYGGFDVRDGPYDSGGGPTFNWFP